MLIFKRIYKKSKKKKKRLTKEQKEEALLRRKWGMDVKKLKGYICCISGTTDRRKLVAHHLDSYHTHPEKRFDLNNGIVIEKSLHKKFHKIYGYKSTTKEQFAEFYLQEKTNMAKGAIKGGGAAKKAEEKGAGKPKTGKNPMKGKKAC